MNRVLFSSIIFGFLVENSLINSVSGDTIVSVTTNNGVVDGLSKDIDGIPVNVFLSIPYAEPPIGSLRFRKPVPVSNWSTPINATQLPDPCYQIPFPSNATLLNGNINEDCLYLNIWQPTTGSCSGNNTKAVIFFIHGGGLLSGSSSEYQFQGPILSTKGDVVVVTINYRLNVFGFFYTGTSGAPGNVGLWDQVLALKWVRHNIGYFCGDPNRITIIGHSGGSDAVSVHVLSPITRPLYKQAVLMSGAFLSIFVATQTVSKQQWLSGAILVGCANASDTSFNAAIIHCMRNIDASLIVSMPFFAIYPNMTLLPPLVVIDGVFLPQCPYAMLESGNFKKDISLMMGSTGDEGQVFMAALPGYGPTVPGNFTYAESKANSTAFLSTLKFYAPVVNAPKAADLYFDLISPESTDYDFLRRATVKPSGDYIGACPTKIFSQSVAKHGNNKTKVYEYFYNSQDSTSVYSCGQWMGACHGSDLTPLFGLAFIQYSNYTDSQRNESVRVIGFFSHFAKYGYPAQQNGIVWPKYYSLHGNIVTPYLYIGTNKWHFGYGLKITECEYFWKKYNYYCI